MKLEGENALKATISAASVKSVLSIFICIRGKATNDWSKIILLFIENVTKESCQNVLTRQVGYYRSSSQSQTEQ